MSERKPKKEFEVSCHAVRKASTDTPTGEFIASPMPASIDTIPATNEATMRFSFFLSKEEELTVKRVLAVGTTCFQCHVPVGVVWFSTHHSWVSRRTDM